MQIDVANLNNLTGLWKKYGALNISSDATPLQYASVSWPHRYWFKLSHVYLNDASWLDKLPETAIVPLWPTYGSKDALAFDNTGVPWLEQQLLKKQWYCAFEQTAMYLVLRNSRGCSSKTRSGFSIECVHTTDDVKTWAAIASEAFGYDIDSSVITNLVNDCEIKILLGWQDEQAVASALLYKTNNVIGIHQVGVKRAFQGRGIAGEVMRQIVNICAQWEGEYLVLQASARGQPLYERMGFRAQFGIKNYQRT